LVVSEYLATESSIARFRNSPTGDTGGPMEKSGLETQDFELPNPSAIEESPIRERLIAIRDVFIVFALRVSFRFIMLLRTLNY
jgi:hypothetical protein